MSLIIPYTFTGGKSAKAQEVNANFQQVKVKFDELETMVASYSAQVGQFPTTYASLNGSSANKFNVANPTSGYNAVNLDYMNNTINWLRYIISGLHMTIVDGDSFSIGLGGCYDSTGNYVILNNTIWTSGNYGTTLGANATYNVFIIAKKAVPGMIYRVALTTSSTPTLGDDEICRKIGTISTDTNKHFSSVAKEEY